MGLTGEMSLCDEALKAGDSVRVVKLGGLISLRGLVSISLKRHVDTLNVL